MALNKGIGKQIQVGIAQESTRGTAKTSASYWLPVDDWAIEERFENAIDSQTYGLVEDSVSQTRVKNVAEGEIRMPVTGTSAAILFHSLFGSSTAVLHSGETTVFDNTAAVLQNVQHKSLTVFVHDPIPTASGATADYTHANAIVSKIDIDYSLGNFVMMNASFRAVTGSAAAVVFTPTQIIEPRFVPQYMTFKVATTYSGLGAASAIKIKSAKISISSPVDDDDVLGQTSPRDFLNKEFSVEGTIEAIWQNETDFKSSAIANTSKAMRLDLVNSDVTIGVATNPQFRLDLAKVFFTEFSRPVKIKDVVYQTVNFKAAYSTTDSFMAKALFVNTVNIGAL
jgi:Phage tail tube protein